MAAISLTNPAGGLAAIETSEIILIFFSPYLSPSGTRSNVALDSGIRSFRETRDQVAQLALPSIKLVKLTLPDIGRDRAKGEIWLAVDLLIDWNSTRSGGASVKMKRRAGPIIVTESIAEVGRAIEAARGA